MPCVKDQPACSQWYLDYIHEKVNKLQASVWENPCPWLCHLQQSWLLTEIFMSLINIPLDARSWSRDDSTKLKPDGNHWIDMTIQTQCQLSRTKNGCKCSACWAELKELSWLWSIFLDESCLILLILGLLNQWPNLPLGKLQISILKTLLLGATHWGGKSQLLI